VTLNFDAEATLYLGLPEDGERLQIRRDTRHFPRLADAIRFAADEMPNDRRYGAYIESAGTKLEWHQIVETRKQLK
jgi:hypothetical protein